MMTYLRSSILATIAYYDTLDYPVTLLEVYKFLVNPGRVHSVQNGFGDISLDDVRRELETLIKLTVISKDGGYYYMNHRDELCAERERRQAIASRKWKKFLSYARFLVLTPYLRGFFASGSMALSNTTPDSDWDVLIIVKHGRMYTARLFLWLIASVLGVRRKPGQEAAPDKLCFNHFLTDKNLTLEHQSMYNAQSYANLKPVYMNEGLFFDFFRSNNWIHNYIYNFEPARHMTGRNIIPHKFFLGIATILEKILNTPLGDLIEHKLKAYQQKRIASNPVTHTPGGRIIYNDRELEFHPYSFEKFVIEKYKENLRKFGIVSHIEEKDSGLSI